MSRAAEVTLAFGGEDRLFRLPIGRLRALQEKTDCGPFELHRRFMSGAWRVDDLRETIFQGLIGGGMEVQEATGLLKSYFDDLPIGQFVNLANAIVMVVLFGVDDEPVGESEAGEVKPKRRSRARKSASAGSTKSAAQ